MPKVYLTRKDKLKWQMLRAIQDAMDKAGYKSVSALHNDYHVHSYITLNKRIGLSGDPIKMRLDELFDLAEFLPIEIVCPVKLKEGVRN